ncbi:MAG: alpha/beta fold hydrolase [Balneolaceae bacterium]|nr:alpha/beta fold hydrolase [Balneolaceae bacterium]
MIPGIRPEFDFVSGDQSKIFFEWNDSSYYETSLYSVDWNGNNLKDVDDEEVYEPVHSPDGSKIAYTKDDDIYVANVDGSNEELIVQSLEDESELNWSPDSQKLAFVMDGNVWVTNVNSPAIQQITKKENEAPNFSIYEWAGNDQLIVGQADYSDTRTLYFPEYVDKFVEPGEEQRGIPEVSIFVASFDTTALDTLVTGKHWSSVSTSHNGRYVGIDWADPPLKHRKIFVHDLQERSKTIVFEDSTDGWISERERDMQFAPEGDQLFFLSEQDGWNHIYTVHADGSNLTQHTSGDYYVPWASWVDEETILFASNEEDYGVRQIYSLDVDDNDVEQLTEETAYRYQFELTPDRSNLIYAKTFFNRPYDLYRLNLENPDEEIQLTNSVPDSFYDYDWQREEYVRFTGRDGETEISASLLYPQDYDESQEYPVVVFVHGAGSLQNVYQGWSQNYWREYMFNQLLNKHGYIVLEVDYRHSLGYGRDFREDVTNWMGKYETHDIVDGLDWAEEHTNGALDLDRVGIYGGSYGGFMALYALTAAPERFDAGAALRKVTNWRNYYYANPWYTLPRLGDPEEVPEHYDRSSPLTYADELEHPVLLLHGLEDDNVGFQDAMQYVQELIESGHQEFDLMVYPNEAHSFQDADSWYDEYRRIFEFFEEELKE